MECFGNLAFQDYHSAIAHYYQNVAANLSASIVRVEVLQADKTSDINAIDFMKLTDKID